MSKKYIKGPVSVELGNRRLMQLAKILVDADKRHRAAGEKLYKQTSWVNRVYDEHGMPVCATPACAYGHWVSAKRGLQALKVLAATHVSCVLPEAAEEFSLSYDESIQLFASAGCGGAITSADAAAYIRRFVEDRRAAAKKVRAASNLS